jgi:hypothetical protein
MKCTGSLRTRRRVEIGDLKSNLRFEIAVDTAPP